MDYWQDVLDYDIYFIFYEVFEGKYIPINAATERQQ